MFLVENSTPFFYMLAFRSSILIFRLLFLFVSISITWRGLWMNLVVFSIKCPVEISKFTLFTSVGRAAIVAVFQFIVFFFCLNNVNDKKTHGTDLTNLSWPEIFQHCAKKSWRSGNVASKKQRMSWNMSANFETLNIWAGCIAALSNEIIVLKVLFPRSVCQLTL